MEKQSDQPQTGRPLFGFTPIGPSYICFPHTRLQLQLLCSFSHNCQVVLEPIRTNVPSLVIEQLKRDRVSLLLAEQNLPLALRTADYVYVVSKGAVVFEGNPGQLQENKEIEQEYLAV